MAKAASLIDKIKSSAPVMRGVSGWHVDLAKENPQLLADINDTIDSWINKDAALRRVCPTKAALAKKLIEFGAPVRKGDTLVRYINSRDERLGKNS